MSVCAYCGGTVNDSEPLAHLNTCSVWGREPKAPLDLRAALEHWAYHGPLDSRAVAAAALTAMDQRDAHGRALRAAAAKAVADYEAWAPGFITPPSMVELRAVLAQARDE